MNKNKSCFLLGGGASLKGFDFHQLDSYDTIGVNKIFMFYSPTYLYCMDRKLYSYIHSDTMKKQKGDENIRELWKNCTSKKYFIASFAQQKNTSSFFKGEDIEVIPRLSQKCISMDIKKGIYPANNSGFGALMIAIALGYKTIYLLGYDMKVTNKHTHFHNGYLNQSPDRQQKHLNNFRRPFESFAPDIARAGITVINLNPDSALNCFKKMRPEEIIGKNK
jgi:hypothetical protein